MKTIFKRSAVEPKTPAMTEGLNSPISLELCTMFSVLNASLSELSQELNANCVISSQNLKNSARYGGETLQK